MLPDAMEVTMDALDTTDATEQPPVAETDDEVALPEWSPEFPVSKASRVMAIPHESNTSAVAFHPSMTADEVREAWKERVRSPRKGRKPKVPLGPLGVYDRKCELNCQLPACYLCWCVPLPVVTWPEPMPEASRTQSVARGIRINVKAGYEITSPNGNRSWADLASDVRCAGSYMKELLRGVHRKTRTGLFGRCTTNGNPCKGENSRLFRMYSEYLHPFLWFAPLMDVCFFWETALLKYGSCEAMPERFRAPVADRARVVRTFLWMYGLYGDMYTFQEPRFVTEVEEDPMEKHGIIRLCANDSCLCVFHYRAAKDTPQLRRRGIRYEVEEGLFAGVDETGAGRKRK